MSDYTAPLHLAVCNHSTLAADEDIVFWCEAVTQQIRDHVAPAWGLPPMAVVFYGESPTIPPDQAAVIGVVNDDGNAASAGYHAKIGELAFGLVDMGQSSVPSRTLSHEAVELFINQSLDRWVPSPVAGQNYAVEAADPTQDDGYLVPVALFGHTRGVEVSDFVLPAWYGLPGPAGGKMNHMDTLDPFEIAPGGYQIAEQNGRTIFLSSREGAFMNAAKMNRTSRTSRLIRKIHRRAA